MDFTDIVVTVEAGIGSIASIDRRSADLQGGHRVVATVYIESHDYDDKSCYFNAVPPRAR
jgi:hypothetical protein